MRGEPKVKMGQISVNIHNLVSTCCFSVQKLSHLPHLSPHSLASSGRLVLGPVSPCSLPLCFLYPDLQEIALWSMWNDPPGQPLLATFCSPHLMMSSNSGFSLFPREDSGFSLRTQTCRIRPNWLLLHSTGVECRLRTSNSWTTKVPCSQRLTHVGGQTSGERETLRDMWLIKMFEKDQVNNYTKTRVFQMLHSRNGESHHDRLCVTCRSSYVSSIFQDSPRCHLLQEVSHSQPPPRGSLGPRVS